MADKECVIHLQARVSHSPAARQKQSGLHAEMYGTSSRPLLILMREQEDGKRGKKDMPGVSEKSWLMKHLNL